MILLRQATTMSPDNYNQTKLSKICFYFEFYYYQYDLWATASFWQDFDHCCACHVLKTLAGLFTVSQRAWLADLYFRRQGAAAATWNLVSSKGIAPNASIDVINLLGSTEYPAAKHQFWFFSRKNVAAPKNCAWRQQMNLHLRLVLALNWCICGNRFPSCEMKIIPHICHNAKYK